ncbi:GNAT family N-acetyltransferase [Streptomyces cucumeris]|uniref:GNAT family N-acetyltransferase n=1 Tax=Streptomyces cucumeris TaxID=2962890 RepID=UPI003EB7E82D
MHIRTVGYGHPDAVALDREVQAEYVQRYGEGDTTPVDAAQFDPPHGIYLIVYDPDGTPLASGGWRGRDSGEEGYADGDAEVKRMFVVRAARGRGLARLVLAALEDSARAAGRRRMIMETGTRQPEAIGLYTSSGYTPVPKFGVYRFDEGSRCFGKALSGDGGDTGDGRGADRDPGRTRAVGAP